MQKTGRLLREMGRGETGVSGEAGESGEAGVIRQESESIVTVSSQSSLTILFA